MQKSDKTVVLCSGGLNSAVLLALARKTDAVAVLTVNYPHWAAEREAGCVRALLERFEVREHVTVDLPHLGSLSGSARVDGRAAIEEAREARRTPSTCNVPGLIGTLANVAFTWASNIGAQKIWLGVSENLGPPAPPTATLYPEHAREFVQLLDDGCAVASPGRAIRVEAPLIEMRRADVIRLGRRLGVPFEQTWSCLASGETPCQRCAGCTTRAHGFVEASEPDPLFGASSEAKAVEAAAPA